MRCISTPILLIGMLKMEHVEIMPEDLRARSLSKREIILGYDDALRAIDILIEARWAILGWEGLVRYPDGRIVHSAKFQGTGSITQMQDEPWDLYVLKSAEFCRTTICEDHERWRQSPEHPDADLYFCLTVMQRY